MHPEARDGLARMLDASGLDLDQPWHVLDLGGRDINGSIRDLLPNAKWTGCDIEAGPGVDLVHDCTTPWPDNAPHFDVVVCTEVLEHVAAWPELLSTCAEALAEGGPQLLYVTCASDGRAAHGAAGGPVPLPGEWYRNVPPGTLHEALSARFRQTAVEYRAIPGDAYAWAEGVPQ
jgi:SAM-dependent methyltransferase